MGYQVQDLQSFEDTLQRHVAAKLAIAIANTEGGGYGLDEAVSKRENDLLVSRPGGGALPLLRERLHLLHLHFLGCKLSPHLSDELLRSRLEGGNRAVALRHCGAKCVRGRIRGQRSARSRRRRGHPVLSTPAQRRAERYLSVRIPEDRNTYNTVNINQLLST